MEKKKRLVKLFFFYAFCFYSFRRRVNYSSVSTFFASLYDVFLTSFFKKSSTNTYLWWYFFLTNEVLNHPIFSSFLYHYRIINFVLGGLLSVWRVVPATVGSLTLSWRRLALLAYNQKTRFITKYNYRTLRHYYWRRFQRKTRLLFLRSHRFFFHKRYRILRKHRFKVSHLFAWRCSRFLSPCIHNRRFDRIFAYEFLRWRLFFLNTSSFQRRSVYKSYTFFLSSQLSKTFRYSSKLGRYSARPIFGFTRFRNRRLLYNSKYNIFAYRRRSRYLPLTARNLGLKSRIFRNAYISTSSQRVSLFRFRALRQAIFNRILLRRTPHIILLEPFRLRSRNISVLLNNRLSFPFVWRARRRSILKNVYIKHIVNNTYNKFTKFNFIPKRYLLSRLLRVRALFRRRFVLRTYKYLSRRSRKLRVLNKRINSSLFFFCRMLSRKQGLLYFLRKLQRLRTNVKVQQQHKIRFMKLQLLMRLPRQFRRKLRKKKKKRFVSSRSILFRRRNRGRYNYKPRYRQRRRWLRRRSRRRRSLLFRRAAHRRRPIRKYRKYQIKEWQENWDARKNNVRSYLERRKRRRIIRSIPFVKRQRLFYNFKPYEKLTNKGLPKFRVKKPGLINIKKQRQVVKPGFVRYVTDFSFPIRYQTTYYLRSCRRRRGLRSSTLLRSRKHMYVFRNKRLFLNADRQISRYIYRYSLWDEKNPRFADTRMFYYSLWRRSRRFGRHRRWVCSLFVTPLKSSFRSEKKVPMSLDFLPRYQPKFSSSFKAVRLGYLVRRARIKKRTRFFLRKRRYWRRRRSRRNFFFNWRKRSLFGFSKKYHGRKRQFKLRRTRRKVFSKSRRLFKFFKSKKRPLLATEVFRLKARQSLRSVRNFLFYRKCLRSKNFRFFSFGFVGVPKVLPLIQKTNTASANLLFSFNSLLIRKRPRFGLKRRQFKLYSNKRSRRRFRKIWQSSLILFRRKKRRSWLLFRNRFKRIKNQKYSFLFQRVFSRLRRLNIPSTLLAHGDVKKKGVNFRKTSPLKRRRKLALRQFQLKQPDLVRSIRLFLPKGNSKLSRELTVRSRRMLRSRWWGRYIFLYLSRIRYYSSQKRYRGFFKRLTRHSLYFYYRLKPSFRHRTRRQVLRHFYLKKYLRRNQISRLYLVSRIADFVSLYRHQMRACFFKRFRALFLKIINRFYRFNSSILQVMLNKKKVSSGLGLPNTPSLGTIVAVNSNQPTFRWFKHNPLRTCRYFTTRGSGLLISHALLTMRYPSVKDFETFNFLFASTFLSTRFMLAGKSFTSQKFVLSVLRYLRPYSSVHLVRFIDRFLVSGFPIYFELSSLKQSNKEQPFPVPIKWSFFKNYMLKALVTRFRSKRHGVSFQTALLTELWSWHVDPMLSILHDFLLNHYAIGMDSRFFVHYRWRVKR